MESPAPVEDGVTDATDATDDMVDEMGEDADGMDTPDAASDPTGVKAQLLNVGSQQNPGEIWLCQDVRAIGFYNDGNGVFGVYETETLSATNSSFNVNNTTGDVDIVILVSSQELKLSAPQFVDENTFNSVFSDDNDGSVNVSCQRTTI